MELDLKLDAQHQYEDVQANFWDYTKQAIENTAGAKPTTNKQGDVDSQKLSAILKQKELVHTTAPVTKEVIQAWADAVYQRGHLSRIRGRMKFVGSSKIILGKTIALGKVAARFNGDGYISKVHHTVKNGQWLTEVEFGLPQRSHLETYPNATPLGAGGALPAISGLQHGVVIKIDGDPDGQYRVLVNIPIIDNLEGEGVWARLANSYATEDCGFIFFPEVGDEVVLGFFDNDPTYPVILGSLYSNKKMITTEETHDPADKNIFKAISFNKGQMRMEFQDDPGNNIMKMFTEDKMMLEINDADDSITLEDPVNKNKMVFDGKGITITSDLDLTIDIKGEIKVTGAKNIAMKATQDIKGEGMNIKLKAQTNFDAQGTMFNIKGSGTGTVDGGGMLTLKGGMVSIN